MKLKKTALLGLLSILPLAACSASANNDTIEDTSSQVTTTVTIDLSANDQNTSYDEATVEKITFNGSSITADGANLSVSGTTLTITGAGDYLISGILTDGEIQITADKEDVVHLIFNGVDLSNADGSPFVVLNADKVIITLAEGSTNTITDGNTYASTSDSDPDAAIYAKDDLTINGTGSLNINSASKSGIHGTKYVLILDATLTINAEKDGIKGKDCVLLQDATTTIDAANDGIQATNDEDQGAGYIAISGGTLDVTAGLDGIQAETQVLVTDGDITISAGNSASSDESGKGIKALLDLSIEGGTLDISSLSDDTLNSNGSLTISGGILTLNAADDAIHASESLMINGGELNITACYEGLESSHITINDGSIRLIAEDDGINTSTGTVSYVKGGTNMTQDDGSTLIITGGTIYISSLSDSIDSNGAITMSGGTLIAFGPTANNNGTIDYNKSFTLSGGTILAVGASGMAQQADSSTINTVMVNLDSTVPSGTLVSIVDADGKLIVAFETIKTANSIVFASETLATGIYTVYSGGSLIGTLSDHATTNGSYTAGTKLTTFTISSAITLSGAAPSGPGGGGNHPPKP